MNNFNPRLLTAEKDGKCREYKTVTSLFNSTMFMSVIETEISIKIFSRESSNDLRSECHLSILLYVSDYSTAG